MKTLKALLGLLILFAAIPSGLQAQEPTYSGKPHQIVGPTYEATNGYSDGMAIVNIDNLNGAIDRDGNLIVPIEYVQINKYSEGLAMFVKRDEAKNITRGALNKAGEVVFTLPNDVGFTLQGFSLGYHPVMRYVNLMRAIWGLINTKGEMTIPLSYDWYSASIYGLRIARNGAYFGFIDNQGEVVIPLSYANAGFFSEEGLAPVCNQEGKWGYIDTKNNVVIPFIYDVALSFENGLAIVGHSRKGEQGFWHGMIDTTGKEVIPTEFLEIEHAYYSNGQYRDAGLIRALKRGTLKNATGYYNYAGELVIPFVEGANEDFRAFYNGLAAVKQKGGWGYMNSTGEMAIPATYAWVADFSHSDFAKVGRGVKNHGVVRRDGVEVLPTNFVNVEISTTDGIFLVQEKKLWGAYNCLGEEILPCLYKNIIYNEGRFCLLEGKLWSIWGY